MIINRTAKYLIKSEFRMVSVKNACQTEVNIMRTKKVYLFVKENVIILSVLQSNIEINKNK